MGQVQPGPWQAIIRAQLTRATGVDTVEEIETDGDGHFTRRTRVIGRPGPGVIVVLDTAQLRQLQGELQAEVSAHQPVSTSQR